MVKNLNHSFGYLKLVDLINNEIIVYPVKEGLPLTFDSIDSFLRAGWIVD